MINKHIFSLPVTHLAGWLVGICVSLQCIGSLPAYAQSYGNPNPYGGGATGLPGASWSDQSPTGNQSNWMPAPGNTQLPQQYTGAPYQTYSTKPQLKGGYTVLPNGQMQPLPGPSGPNGPMLPRAQTTQYGLWPGMTVPVIPVPGSKFSLPPTRLDSFVQSSGFSEAIYGDEGTTGLPPNSAGFAEENTIGAGMHQPWLSTGHASQLPSAWLDTQFLPAPTNPIPGGILPSPPSGSTFAK